MAYIEISQDRDIWSVVSLDLGSSEVCGVLVCSESPIKLLLVLLCSVREVRGLFEPLMSKELLSNPCVWDEEVLTVKLLKFTKLKSYR